MDYADQSRRRSQSGFLCYSMFLGASKGMLSGVASDHSMTSMLRGHVFLDVTVHH